MAYRPEEQTWRQLQSSPGGVWVGMQDADPPAPFSLARTKQIPGHVVELADGNQWTIPVARAWTCVEDVPTYGAALPRYLDVDPDGHWVYGDVQREYAALWGAAEEFGGYIAGMVAENASQGFAMLDPNRYYGAAVTALATNYAVSATELVMLQCLTEPAVQEVLLALIDWPTLQDLMVKKKRFESSAIDLGRKDSAPDIVPLLAS
jgi:hypothetical protein